MFNGSIFYFFFLINLFFLPFSLFLLLLIDIVFKKKFIFCKCLIFLTLFLFFSFIGLLKAFFSWLFFKNNYSYFISYNSKIKKWWAYNIFFSAQKLFSINIKIRGLESLQTNSAFIFFMRHVSLFDVLLMEALVAYPFDISIRYIMKKELLWNPCIDIVGQRLVNYFVNRSARNKTLEIKNISLLAKNLKVKDSVLIYPEGTRFNIKKRTHILRKLKKSNNIHFYKYAKSLKKTLPPRLGGSLGLLVENNNEADVVFCNHIGFEIFSNFIKLFQSNFIGNTIFIKFNKVLFKDIPKNKKNLKKWFLQRWLQLDKETILSNKK